MTSRLDANQDLQNVERSPSQQPNTPTRPDPALALPLKPALVAFTLACSQRCPRQ